MSTVVKSTDPCPVCLMQNKTMNILQTRQGQFYTYCAAGHKFEDTEELNILRANARRQYPNVYAGLQPAAPAPIDPTLLADQDIVINPEMKKTIEEMTGVTFTGASDLKGMIFAYVQDNQNKEQELKELRAKATQSSARGSDGGFSLRPIKLRDDQMILTVQEWAIQGIAGMAEYTQQTPEEWVNDQFNGWLEQQFMVPQGQKRA